MGHRRIAARLGVPASTVRGWARLSTAREALDLIFYLAETEVTEVIEGDVPPDVRVADYLAGP